MGHVARLGVIALDVVLIATALGDDLAAVEERVADLDRFIERPARVRAKVNDIAERLASSGLVDGGDRRLSRFTSAGGELIDIDVADAFLDLPFDRADLDVLAHD